MDWSPTGSSVHRILQARILEWVAIPFSRVPSRPKDWTWVSWISCTACGLFTTEPLGEAPFELSAEAKSPRTDQKWHEGDGVGHVRLRQKPLSLQAPLSFNWTDLSLTNDEDEDVFMGRPRTIYSTTCLGTWKVNSWALYPQIFFLNIYLFTVLGLRCGMQELVACGI